MDFRKLGRTHLKVSVIGLGSIPLQKVSKKKGVKIVNRALDSGINFIETGRNYTDSEEKIGLVLEKRRDECIIASKSKSRTRTEMQEDIDESLKNLKTDKIDIYQIHLVEDEDTLNNILSQNGALEALKNAREQGKIDYMGITAHKPDLAIKAIKTKEFDTVQVPFNAIETDSTKVFDVAKSLGIGTIVMKPFGGGAIKNVKAELKYIMEHDVSTILVGMDKLYQVTENTSSDIFLRLTDNERNVLLTEANEIGKTFCRRCGYCSNVCPQGIDPATVFRLYMYFTRYGIKGAYSKGRYKKLKAKASDCTECGECEKHCSYNLPIRDMLKEVEKTFGE